MSVDFTIFQPHSAPLKNGAEVYMMSKFSHINEDFLVTQIGTYEEALHKDLPKYTYNEVVFVEYPNHEKLTRELPTGNYDVLPLKK